MRKLLLTVLITGFVAAIPSSALGAVWHYMPDYDGTLTVHGTIDCVPQEPPLFDGHVLADNVYAGSVPFWANDYQINFVADPPGCENRNEQYKVAVLRWDGAEWVLDPLDYWLDNVLEPNEPIVLPAIADMRPEGGLPVIYSVVDLNVWCADPRLAQSTYDIVAGTCPDLPGFLISTEPITFDPASGFQITPLTGPVDLIGELTLRPRKEPVPTVSEWGLIILTLLGLTAGTIVFGRRRRPAVA